MWLFILSALLTYGVNLEPNLKKAIVTPSVKVAGRVLQSNRVKGVILFEGFEDGVCPPPGWSYYILGDTGGVGWSIETTIVYEGNFAIYHNDDYVSNGVNDWLVSPPVYIPDDSTLLPILRFYEYERYPSWYNYHGIWISTTSPDPDSGNYVELAEVSNPIGNQWIERIYDLSAFRSDTIYIAFVYVGEYDDEWYLDNISVEMRGHDIAAIGFYSPDSLIFSVGDTIVPGIMVANVGGAPEDSFWVGVRYYIITSDSLIHEDSILMTDTLLPGEVDSIEFPTLSIPQSGIYYIIGWVRCPGDIDTTDDETFKGFIVPDSVLDFEDSDGGFSANDGWDWGEPTWGPSAAHSGTKLWGTVLDTNYSNHADYWLIKRFEALQNSPVIAFANWWYTETNFDGGNIVYSTDGGQTWNLIYPYNGYPDSSVYALGGEPGFSGHSAIWTYSVGTIPVDSGTIFQLALHFASDGSVTYPGWYIDDFMWVGMAPYFFHDVGVHEVITGFGYAEYGDTLMPEVTVVNFGDFDETFYVHFVYGDVYHDSVSVTLNSGEAQTVSFSPYVYEDTTVIKGCVYTVLSNDVVRANDKMVGYVGIPLTSVSVPFTEDTITLDGVINPDEWNDATVIDISDIFGFDMIVDTLGTALLFMTHDSSYLYLGFDLPTELADTGQYSFGFDDDYSRSWDSDSTEGVNAVLQGIGWYANAFLNDSTGTGWYPTGQTSYAISLSSGHAQAEVAVPLVDSVNDFGPQRISIDALPDTIGAFFYYINTVNTIAAWWPATFEWPIANTVGTLTLEEAPVKIGEFGDVLRFELLPVSPNPVMKDGIVRFSIPKRAAVRIDVLDIAGRVVQKLVDGKMTPGVHTLPFNVGNLRDGVYFIRMESDNYTSIKRFIVVR